MQNIANLKSMIYSSEDKDNYIKENALELACSALDEATYYGKNKYLLQVEEIFNDMLLDYQSVNQIKDVSNLCDDKRFNKIGKLLATCFGFSDVSINDDVFSLFQTVQIIRNIKHGQLSSTITAGRPNAFTCTGSHLMKVNRKIKYTMSNEGRTVRQKIPGENREVIKLTDTGSYKMSLYLHPTLFYNHGDASLTGAELTAICLHEIGHNFYDPGPIRTVASVMVDAWKNKLFKILTFEGFWLFLDIMNQKVVPANNPVLRAMVNIPNKVFGSIYSTVGAVYAVIFTFSNALTACRVIEGTARLIFKSTQIKDTLKATINYDNEKYADSFTAAYGYATEQYSALDKLSMIHDPTIILTNSQNDTINAIINNTVTLFKIPAFFFTWYYDPHGTNVTRLKNMIDYLEESNLSIKDPKLRKEYDEQLKQIKRLREEMKNPPNIMPTNITKAALAIIQDTLNCSDVRDLISHIKPRVDSFANLDYAE